MLCLSFESSSHREKLIGWAIDLGLFGWEGETGSLAVEGSVNHRIDLQRYPIRRLASRVCAEIPSRGHHPLAGEGAKFELARWTGKKAVLIF